MFSHFYQFSQFWMSASPCDTSSASGMVFNGSIGFVSSTVNLELFWTISDTTTSWTTACSAPNCGGGKRSFEVRKQFRTAEGDFPDALAVLKFDFSSKIPVVFFLRTDARRNLCTCVWVLVRFQCKGPWAALETNVQIGHQCCMCLNLYWNQCRHVPVCFGNLKRIQYTETSKSTSCFNGFFSTGVLPSPGCLWAFPAGFREWPSLALPTQPAPRKPQGRNCWGFVILLSFCCDSVVQPGVSFGVRPAVARARWELQEIRQKGGWGRTHHFPVFLTDVFMTYHLLVMVLTSEQQSLHFYLGIVK